MKRALIALAGVTLLSPAAPRAQEALPEPSAEPGPAPSGDPGTIELAPAPDLGGAPSSEPTDTQTYVVQTGDTLWDISQKFLGNPWYWPKVWSYNPEIENPHWIYPGNLVRFYPSADDLPSQLDAEDLPPVPADIGDVTSGNLNAPDLFNQEDDIVEIAQGMKLVYDAPRTNLVRQDGLITPRELEEAGIIERAWAEKEMLSTFDRVYLKFRNNGNLRVGDLYSIFRTIGEVAHPTTKMRYGYLTHVIGALRIVSIEKSGVVVAVIDQTIEEIRRGDFVGPLGNFSKQVITKAASRPIEGIVLCALEPNQPLMGQHHLIFIDKGSKDGVEEGNVFSVVRRGDPLRSKSAEDAQRLPLEEVATIVVVDVKDSASAGMVVRSIRELVPGDPVVARSAARAGAN